MKNFLFKAKCTLLIPLITTCAMTSCVEDEKSPFINDYEETIDVKLPGGKIFYIGSEVELRGSGFTSGDKIYVKNTNDISQRVIEARVQSYYDTRLFFIMPADIGDTAYEVEVTLSRYGETYDLGTLSVSQYSIYNTGSASEYEYSDLITINGEAQYNNKVYYQEMAYDENTGDYVTVGSKKEAQIVREDESGLEAVAFPLGEQYTVTYEHNGELAASVLLHSNNYMFFNENASVGDQVGLEWQGFETDDEIVLTQGVEIIATATDTYVSHTGAYFTVPQVDAGSYEIRVLREGILSRVIGQLYVY